MLDEDFVVKNGAVIAKCKHCDGTGECSKGEDGFSCEYCIRKNMLVLDVYVPHVPCIYCDGKGFHVVKI